MKYSAILLMTLSLAACEEIVSEQEGSFVYEGETYRSVTREYARGGGTYERRIIYVRPRAVSCSTVDDLDCVGAIRNEWLDVR